MDISTPVLVLRSKDESEDKWHQFQHGLKVPYQTINFPDMVNGWMSARGDLSDEKVQEGFQKGYQPYLTGSSLHVVFQGILSGLRRASSLLPFWLCSALSMLLQFHLVLACRNSCGVRLSSLAVCSTRSRGELSN